MKKRFWIALILAAVALVPAPATAQGGDYVEITVPVANVRVSPTTSSEVIGRASWSETFEYEGQQGDWLEINMFSGEYRWVHNSVASRTNKVPSYPQSEAKRRSIFQAMVRAQDRAVREAEQRYPSDYMAAIDLERLLYDRYQLEVATASDFPVAHWSRLKMEGVRNGWVPSMD